MFKAGFAEIDITPPLGTEKAGWLIKQTADRVLDPLYARIAVFESGGEKVGFASLDTLSIRWTQVDHIRTEVGKRCGIKGGNIMVAATHNHAGPAIANIGATKRDDTYLAFLVERVVEGFVQADERLVPAKLGMASGAEGRISFNRRYIARDGRTICQPSPGSTEVICAEGVIDTELGVVCAKDTDDRVLGFITNFACHPTHHGGGGDISAGYLGVFANELKARFGANCVNVFLNGACGNIHHANHVDADHDDSMERMGAVLAADTLKVLADMLFSDDITMAAASETIRLPIRPVSEADLEPRERSQRYGTDQIYRDSITRLVAKRKARDYVPAEIQVIRLGDTFLAAVPAEYFVELGLRIKLESWPNRTYVVSCANGMVGYVPHSAAFERGGYETTLAEWSKLVPEAADMIADKVLEIIAEMTQEY